MPPNVQPLVTAASKSADVARKRVLQLFRDWIRSAPDIVEVYNLDIPTRKIRQRVREEFEKNRLVGDLGTIDRLLFKGRLEYEETMNQWKQKTHVLRYFPQDDYVPRKPVTFLEKFYAGRKD